MEMASLIYVAMSGGVDSSVAAALLKKEGYRVVGVFFKPWSPGSGETAKFGTSGLTAHCNWQADRLDAMRVCAKRGIEFKTWDFSKEYGEKVAKYMIDGYRAGITPNPDVACNKEIKFGLFLKKALAEGADFIATGHYARITKNEKRITLYKAKDPNKDQTYFLWTLMQDQLKHVLFPIGGYTKPEVRQLAKKFGLPNHAKKDSQGVCFVGELDMKDFLKEFIKPQPGEIRLISPPSPSYGKRGTEGAILGTHEGASYYTIGQRHGLNITNGKGPYFVASKDIKKNIVYVSKFRMTNDEFRINEINWINDQNKFPLKAKIKIRYRTEEIPAEILKSGEIKFKKPVVALTLGQSAVIYKGEEVLGGGIINS